MAGNKDENMYINQWNMFFIDKYDFFEKHAIWLIRIYFWKTKSGAEEVIEYWDINFIHNIQWRIKARG